MLLFRCKHAIHHINHCHQKLGAVTILNTSPKPSQTEIWCYTHFDLRWVVCQEGVNYNSSFYRVGQNFLSPYQVMGWIENMVLLITWLMKLSYCQNSNRFKHNFSSLDIDKLIPLPIFFEKRVCITKYAITVSRNGKKWKCDCHNTPHHTFTWMAIDRDTSVIWTCMDA